MSTALLRLSEQVDELIPHLVVFALARWLSVLLVWSPLRFLCNMTLFTSQATTQRMLRALYAPAGTCTRVTLVTLFSFYALDVWSNADLLHSCEPHPMPRSMGISAGVCLVCFLLTGRVVVSLFALVTFLCVRDRNVLTGLAVCTTTVEWLGHGRLCGYLVVVIISGWHGLSCTLGSSAALSLCVAATVQIRLVREACRVTTRFAGRRLASTRVRGRHE
jgi:hypothetical protein